MTLTKSIKMNMKSRAYLISLSMGIIERVGLI